MFHSVERKVSLLFSFKFSFRFCLIVSSTLITGISFAQTSVKSILVNENIIYAATNYGVYVDSNYRFEWKTLNQGMPDGAEISLLHTFDKTIYGAVQGDGLYFINLNDSIWKKLTSLPPSFSRICSIRSNDTSLYIVDPYEGIAYSTDHCKSWKFLDLAYELNKNNVSIDSEKENTKKKSKKNNELTIEKITPEQRNKVTDIILLQDAIIASISLNTPGAGLLKSTDGGKSWLEASFDLARVNINKIHTCRNKMYVISTGLNSQVFYSEDQGKHWKIISKSPRWGTFFSVTEKLLFSGYHQNGISVSYTNGKSWSKIECIKLEPDQNVTDLVSIGDLLYVGTTDGIYLLEEKNGAWKLRNEGLKTKKEGAFKYSEIGKKNNITLSVAKFSDNIIFKVKNESSKMVHVDLRLEISCNYEGENGMVALPKQTMDWRITVKPNSTRSFDTDPAACSIPACKGSTNHWEITNWKIN